jgi:hypothetical protein
MTYQGGPNIPRDPPDVPHEPNVRRGEDHIRRDDGTWNMVAGAIALAFILGLGFMLFAGERSSTDNPRTTQRIEKPDTPARPAPNQPPAAKPAPTPPAQ